MKAKVLSLTVLFNMLLVLSVDAQNIIKSLEEPVAGQGTVKVTQDRAISNLFDKDRDREEMFTGEPRQIQGESRTFKTTGYRIQVYAGNNSRDARNQAEQVGSKVKAQFPELSVYTNFQSPRWLCRVGDFRGIEEANAMMRKLKSTGQFKEVSIVKEQINITY